MLFEKLATSKVRDIKTSSTCLLKLIDRKFNIYENRIEVSGEIFVTDNMISISFTECKYDEMRVAKKFLSDIEGFSIINRYTRNSDSEIVKDIVAITMNEEFYSIKIEILKNQKYFYDINSYWKCSERGLFPDYEYENKFNNIESSIAVYLKE